ncbi:DUF1080 domain-containing protein [Phenylobacterium sp.]|uniref:3-keto-disaccharide hydrolase n=1 Tax=Phenylobacterium sp. TaxID=1871053 RepID=UPI00286AF1AD|nr:DUF1080 domain-containing protein [Phenylobacterium sp.]
MTSRIDRRGLVAGLTTAALAPPAFARPRAKSLFDGRTLDGWTPVGDANWGVRDRVISADAGGMSFLVSRESYRDFELHAEIWVSPDANSGIFIRCSDPVGVTADNAYEVNVFDTRPDPTYGTGAIVNLAKVSPMPKAGGRWNTMDVTARGDSLTVVFNGRKTVDGARDPAHAEGPIALQYGAGVVKFRKIEIRAL